MILKESMASVRFLPRMRQRSPQIRIRISPIVINGANPQVFSVESVSSTVRDMSVIFPYASWIKIRAKNFQCMRMGMLNPYSLALEADNMWAYHYYLLSVILVYIQGLSTSTNPKLLTAEGLLHCIQSMQSPVKLILSLRCKHLVSIWQSCGTENGSFAGDSLDWIHCSKRSAVSKNTSVQVF